MLVTGRLLYIAGIITSPEIFITHEDIQYDLPSEFSSNSNKPSILLSEAIDRVNWITLVERTESVTLTLEKYEQLLEYKYMYEDLCE